MREEITLQHELDEIVLEEDLDQVLGLMTADGTEHAALLDEAPAGAASTPPGWEPETGPDGDPTEEDGDEEIGEDGELDAARDRSSPDEED
jgi:hypothetical protein